jgi:hypothetical protein
MMWNLLKFDSAFKAEAINNLLIRLFSLFESGYRSCVIYCPSGWRDSWSFRLLQVTSTKAYCARIA